MLQYLIILNVTSSGGDPCFWVQQTASSKSQWTMCYSFKFLKCFTNMAKHTFYIMFGEFLKIDHRSVFKDPWIPGVIEVLKRMFLFWHPSYTHTVHGGNIIQEVHELKHNGVKHCRNISKSLLFLYVKNGHL